MPKFEVKLSGCITETRDYELKLIVDADNEEEASSAAMEQAAQASAPWQLDTSTLNIGTLPSDVEVESVRLCRTGSDWKAELKKLNQEV